MPLQGDTAAGHSWPSIGREEPTPRCWTSKQIILFVQALSHIVAKVSPKRQPLSSTNFLEGSRTPPNNLSLSLSLFLSRTRAPYPLVSHAIVCGCTNDPTTAGDAIPRANATLTQHGVCVRARERACGTFEEWRD